MSYAGKIDNSLQKNNYEPYTTGRGSYTPNEPKSASRPSSSYNRSSLNENDNLSSILSRKRGEVETKM